MALFIRIILTIILTVGIFSKESLAQLPPHITDEDLTFGPEHLAQRYAELSKTYCQEHHNYILPFAPLDPPLPPPPTGELQIEGSGSPFPPGYNICTNNDPLIADSYHYVFICFFNYLFPTEEEANCPPPSKLRRETAFEYICARTDFGQPISEAVCNVPGFKVNKKLFFSSNHPMAGQLAQFSCLREDIPTIDTHGHYETPSVCKSPGLMMKDWPGAACCGIPKPQPQDQPPPQFPAQFLPKQIEFQPQDQPKDQPNIFFIPLWMKIIK